MIDWSPITTALVTLIAALITTLVPVFVDYVFKAVSTRLVVVKQVADKNQTLAHDVVVWVEASMKTASSNVKLQAAIAKFNETLNLPTDTIVNLLETAISAAKFEAADDWAKLGTSTVAPIAPTAIPDQPIPQETPPTDPDTLPLA